MDRDFQALILILGAWVLFFFIHSNYSKQIEKASKSLYRSMRKAYRRRKAHRLCGYHTVSYLRPGMIALLDSDNCEECAREL